jgi:hypothetical protein
MGKRRRADRRGIRHVLTYDNAVSASAFPIRPIMTLDLDHGATAVTSTPEAKRIAIASEGPFISVADMGESLLKTLKLKEPSRHIAINSRGDSLAVVSASHTLQVVGLESAFGRELARLDAHVHDVVRFRAMTVCCGRSACYRMIVLKSIATMHEAWRLSATIGSNLLSAGVASCLPFIRRRMSLDSGPVGDPTNSGITGFA